MSLYQKIPADSIPIQTESRFTATFNNPTLGQYDFNVAANRNVLIHPTNRDSIYLLDKQSFSLDIPEGVFKSAIDTPPMLSFRDSKTNSQILQLPIPYINYFDNLDFSKYYQAIQDGANIVGTMTGVLDQPVELDGIVTITALVQFVIYEIRDQNWIRNYLDPKTVSQGAYMRMRGMR